nr:copia protein [Tanacetum cinerariifolium]
MATKHLDAYLSGTLVDQTKYQSMVGALIYLTASRPDIVHATCYCARYQEKPTEKHLTAVKRIFRYLKDTINMGLWFPKDTSFKLTAFLDSNHAGCLDSQAGYVSLSACCAQVLWMRTHLTDYGFHFDKIPMYCDSKAAITISCNPIQHSRTKHIDVRYHFIKEKVEKGIIELFFVGTEYQLADLFTKALSEERRNESRSTTNMVEFDIGQEDDKFWHTASARTLDSGEIELNATVDGQDKTTTEAFVRRHLKLADVDGISTLPTTEIFEQLALMGYVTDSDKLTFQKGLPLMVTGHPRPHSKLVLKELGPNGVALVWVLDMLPLPCSASKLEAAVVALPNPSCISLVMASSPTLIGTLD